MIKLPPEQQKIVDDLTKGKNLHQQQEVYDMLGLPFEWPSIEQQIEGKGERKGVKRGRAQHEREMYVIPGFEIEGVKNPFTGFKCHPRAAVASAYELLRLAREDGLIS